MEKATFGAGCFWGVEDDFKSLDGVTQTRVGYSGGHKARPTYEEVCTGDSGHAEVCEVTFDPKLVSFSQLLDKFWVMHDPTTKNRQGPDVGEQYRSIIFCHSSEQEKEAQKSLNSVQQKFPDPIVTQIEMAKEFFAAEEYHQNYFEKNGRVCNTGR